MTQPVIEFTKKSETGWPIPPSFGAVGLFVMTPQSQGQPQQQWKTWWLGIGELCWEVYRRRFVPTRLAATLLPDGAPCFAICACPALVSKRVCSFAEGDANTESGGSRDVLLGVAVRPRYTARIKHGRGAAFFLERPEFVKSN